MPIPSPALLHRLALLLSLVFTTSALHAAETETQEYENGLYHVRRIPKTDQSRLDLRWTDAQRKPLSNFSGLQQQLSQEGKNILFATNAGIYAYGPTPCGLTISASIEWVPLNSSDGEGNFFLKPNGVFYLDDKTGPGIAETQEYAALGLKPRLANQSGPLILRQGRIHPVFNPHSTNVRQRSAVGIVKGTGEIVFVMSDRNNRSKGRVTFHQLARFFLHLGCEDALFLDGEISQMISNPPPNASFSPNTFAAMFVLTD